jgi:hypothetical protein
VISEPTAMIGSGRRPLSNGIHAVSRTKPAAQLAALLDVTAGPNRGSTSRDSSSQHTSPAIRSGSRIHRLASLTWVISASKL